MSMPPLSASPPVEILIAEDSPTQARQLQHMLEQHGYQVTAASNGRLALEAARRRKPALVISDVVMPEMSGYDLCRAIKADAALAEVPVILVTTMSEPEDVIRGLECRADNFILKPYEERYLLGRVQFVLVNREMRQADCPGMALEILFSGQKHYITADRLQILNLLLSTYDAAIHRNRQLSSTQDKLSEANAVLRELTADLENRVARRTEELARSNAALKQAYDDLRRTQQAVMQQERLRALGQMASGIAHDINNAISPVVLYTESLLEKETGLSARGRNHLETIQHAIDDVTATVARLREFCRQREPEISMSPIALNRLVQQVLDLTRVRWNDMPQQRGAMIRVETELAPKLPAVLVVEGELRDALTNLILNALDAMPGDGTLTLRTRLAASGSGGQPAVAVEVADTGIGMSEETRRRCLEPFFTTKGDRGTGLGLAMVYGTVERHQAALEIESALGEGTTIRLIFAAADPADSSPTPSQLPPDALPSLRLLIVDDDSLLIKSLRDILEVEGHSVCAADGGQAGIEAFLAAREKGEPFDAVITDLGMPYVDGRKVAAAVKAASPATPVILFTGWGERMVAEGETPAHVDRVLSKPPKLREIHQALSAVTRMELLGK